MVMKHPKHSPKQKHANQKQKNVGNRGLSGGVRHSVQRPQNVGSNGWA